MRKLVIYALTLTTIFATLATGIESASASPVRYARTSDGNGWSPRDVKQAIHFVARKWTPPGGVRKAMSVARCESGFNEHASNSCCSGVFQQHRSYWDGRRRKYNPHHGWKLGPSVYNARTNIVISIRMADHVGWGDWSCA